jgi:hypothetical protein
MLLVAVVLILLRYGYCSGDKTSTPPTSSKMVTAPVAPPAPRTCQNPWTIQPRDIPAQGGLAVYLCPGWQDYPQGGAITITTPSGRVLKDEPGVLHNLGDQPEGIYIFRADPPGSKRKVRIYNRW